MSSRTGCNQSSELKRAACLATLDLGTDSRQFTEDHSDTSVDTTFHLMDRIMKCEQAIDMVWQLERKMWQDGMFREPTLMSLEKEILDLLAYDVTEGVFYGQVLEFNGRCILRYIEGGRMFGFAKCYQEYLNRYQLIQPEMYHLRIYSPSDIAARKICLDQRKNALSAAHGTTKEPAKRRVRNRVGEIYKRQLTQGKTNILSLLTSWQMQPNSAIRNIVFYAVKQSPKNSKAEDRFLTVHPSCVEQSTALENLLRNHVVTGSSGQMPASLESFSTEPLPLTLEKQFEILSVLPNNHWWQYPCLFGTLSDADCSNVGCYHFLAFRPCREQDAEFMEDSTLSTANWRLPTSARNRFIYFISHGQYERAGTLIKHLLTVSNTNTRPTK